MNLKIEISKGIRKCSLCKKKINKGSRVIVESNLKDIFIKGGDKRTVYDKKHYCDSCGKNRAFILISKQLKDLSEFISRLLIEL